MENIDFSKCKQELDAQHQDLDKKRLAAIQLSQEIWAEQLKLQGKYKMLEDLETASKEAEKSKKAEKPLGKKK